MTYCFELLISIYHVPIYNNCKERTKWIAEARGSGGVEKSWCVAGVCGEAGVAGVRGETGSGIATKYSVQSNTKINERNK